MDAPPHRPPQIQPSREEPVAQNDAVSEAGFTVAPEYSTASSMSITTDVTNACEAITVGKTKEKHKLLGARSKPSSSSSDFSCSTASSSQSLPRKRGIRLFRSRRDRKSVSRPGRPKEGDVGALALPLGMSIAAVVAQVLKRKYAADKSMSTDHLSRICAGAVRESLLNVYGDTFESFVENFEKSFRSTLMTLLLIHKSAKGSGGEKENPDIMKCSSEGATATSSNRLENFVSDSGVNECWSNPLQASSTHREPSHHEEMEEEDNTMTNFRNIQLVVHDTERPQQMVSVSPSRNSSGFNDQSIQSTLERSIMEQARSNDLKTFGMRLTMKKLELKERQLALSENANLLERWKLSFGFSKASFKREKFKTQWEDQKHAELLRKCIDCLVTGLLFMLACVGYGVFVYSHKRISEATTACTPVEEPGSWWIPKPMSSVSSGLQVLRCQFQVLTRMLAGGFMVLAIAYLLLQRSSSSNQAMPVTFIVLLLAGACGIAGKLCVDTLGGSGNHWLGCWEILCCLHLFSNLWTSILFRILYGPLNVSGGKKTVPRFPYWMRRCVFYGITCFFLPLLCGFLPFASIGEWKGHFSSLILVGDRESILDEF